MKKQKCIYPKCGKKTKKGLLCGGHRRITGTSSISKAEGLASYALEVEQKEYASEQWFRSLYRAFRHSEDLYNAPLKGFLPDVVNHKYKYVIEIDGSIHSTPEVAARDLVKDKIFKKLGYKVIRIQAYNPFSFQEGLTKVFTARRFPPTKVSITNPDGTLLTFEYLPPKKSTRSTEPKEKKEAASPPKTILRKNR